MVMLPEDENYSPRSEQKGKIKEIEAPSINNDFKEKLLGTSNTLENELVSGKINKTKHMSNEDRNTFLDTMTQSREKQKHNSVRTKETILMLQTCSQGYQLLNATGTNDITLTSSSLV